MACGEDMALWHSRGRTCPPAAACCWCPCQGRPCRASKRCDEAKPAGSSQAKDSINLLLHRDAPFGAGVMGYKIGTDRKPTTHGRECSGWKPPPPTYSWICVAKRSTSHEPSAMSRFACSLFALAELPSEFMPVFYISERHFSQAKDFACRLFR